MREVNMITVNDLKKHEKKCLFNIYQRYQATMAGQLNDDIEQLEK